MGLELLEVGAGLAQLGIELLALGVRHAALGVGRLGAVVHEGVEGILLAEVLEEVFRPLALEHAVGDLQSGEVPASLRLCATRDRPRAKPRGRPRAASPPSSNRRWWRSTVRTSQPNARATSLCRAQPRSTRLTMA